MSKYRNTVLKNLDSEAIASCPSSGRLSRYSIQHLFFIEEAVASLTTTFQDGSQVEAGIFGLLINHRHPRLVDTERSLNRVYTHIHGYGYALPGGPSSQ